MTRIPIAPYHVRCRDGRIISILDPVRRLDRSQEEETYITDPGVRMRAVPEDPAIETSGIARYWRYHNRREGDDATYNPVPVGLVRAFIRLHGGVDEIGPSALAELKRAAELEKAQPEPSEPVMGAPVTDSHPAAVEEAAAEGPFPTTGEPWWPGGPRPRLLPGHRISMTWAARRRGSSSMT